MRIVAIFCTALLSASLAAHTGGSAKSHVKPASAGKLTAVFDTTAGKLTCALFPDKTPNAVANFVGLATGKKEWIDPNSHERKHTPLYDGTIFHRVIPNFMIQGGDPAGTGAGNIGFSIKDEIVRGLNFDRPGRLAYANSGPDTNGSQFFITELPYPSLDGHYVIFGQCDDASVELVKKIARKARDERDDRPYDAVKINHINIVNSAATQASAAKPVKKTTANKPTTK